MNLRNTASSEQYMKVHTENLQKISPGSVYDNMFSITVMELFRDNLYYMRDIIYMSLTDSYKKYIIDQDNNYPSPYEHLSVIALNVLKDRIMMKTHSNKLCEGEEYKEKIDEYFKSFCEEKIEEKELILLENLLHIDDHLLTDWFVPSEFNLREKALGLINKSDNGSWLVRRSSVVEQTNVKVRVITFKKSLNALNEIKHYLFAQIDGFGYALTNTFSGDSVPKIGENRPICIYHTFRSLPSLLTYMKGQGLSLDKIVKL
jgi:hypothetical protein